eukprot:TRINITY_DN1990_c0_g1_i1.p1 TRINITY_DN1990_c0_g1~~TRINITY_DN1990_c0_g1_i1.p1  ORF type:complete len:444 (-),score=91.46 TRINITY_DN1990_c0_g1_i1:2054-3319(-)
MAAAGVLGVVGIGYFAYSMLSIDDMVIPKKKRVKYRVHFDQVKLDQLIDQYQYAFENQKYDEAHTYITEILRMIRSELGEGHPLMATMLFHFYELHVIRGKIKDADAVLTFAINILENSSKPDSINLSIMYEAKAKLDIQQENYTSARNYAAKYIACFKRNPGAELMATYLMGKIDLETGHYDSALDHLQDTIPLITERFGYYHTTTAEQYISMAEVYHRLGNITTAIDTLESYLKQLNLGKQSIAELIISRKLASFYQKSQHMERAEDLWTKCIELSLSLNNGYGQSLNDLYSSLREQGKTEEAGEIEEKIKAQSDKVLTETFNMRTMSYNLTSIDNSNELEVKMKILRSPELYRTCDFELLANDGTTLASGKKPLLHKDNFTITIKLEEEQTAPMTLKLSIKNERENLTYEHYQIVHPQ